MIPSIGRIVHILPTSDMIAHIGGNVQADTPAPAIITFVHDVESGLVNLQVFGDGDRPSFWLSNVTKGEGPGQWHQPPHVS